MKKIVLTVMSIICVGLLFQACKEDKIDYYNSKSSVVFTNMMYPVANTFYTSYTIDEVEYTQRFLSGKDEVDSIVKSSFLNVDGDVARVYIPISVVGNISSETKSVAVKVNYLPEESGEAENAIKGVDYNIVVAEVPANSWYGAVIIDFKKENMNDLYRPKVQMEVQLVANDNFDVAMTEIKSGDNRSTKSNPTKITVTCSYGQDTPGAWNDLYLAQLGYFTSKKLNVLVNVLGFNQSHLLADTREEGPALSIIQGMATTLSAYLSEMKTLGTPVYEDRLDKDGNPIPMHMKKNILDYK